MFARRILGAFLALTMFLSICTFAYAASNDELLQAYVNEQSIDIFVSKAINSNDLNCKVSNKDAQILDAGLLANKGVTIRTTILIDNSTSIPTSSRSTVVEYLENVIKNISKNEQLRIGVFGKDLSIVQDFTSDRYDLSNSIKDLQFNGTQSRFYDAIFKTMPTISPIDGKPCFYRTIIISDGIDVSSSGVTKEELLLRLQNSTYPVDVIAVSSGKQSEPEKELSSISRVSGGRYYNLYKGCNTAELVSDLSTNEYYWIRASVPISLLDGSTRQVNINGSSYSLVFDIKFPVYEGEFTESSSTESSSTSSSSSSSEEISSSSSSSELTESSSDVSENSDNKGEGLGIYLIVIIAIGAIILIVIILSVIATIKSKKKNASRNFSPAPMQPNDAPETEIFNEGEPDSAANGICVKIRDMNNPDMVWDMSLSKSGSILIGRIPPCQIIITDRSASRKQCELYLSPNGRPMIKNISDSNITTLNGKKLNSPSILSNDDIIKFGRIKLSVQIYNGAPTYDMKSEFYNV